MMKDTEKRWEACDTIVSNIDYVLSYLEDAELGDWEDALKDLLHEAKKGLEEAEAELAEEEAKEIREMERQYHADLL